MICNPLNLLDCAISVGGSVVDTAMSGIAEAVYSGIDALVAVLASWLYVPSDPVCPTSMPAGSGVISGGWVTACQAASSPANALRSYVLPVTVLVAVGGLIWQGITMAITRKGEPLLQAIRGLWHTALWGAVGIAGTQIALRGSDAFADWIINSALGGTGPGGFTTGLSTILVAGLPAEVILGIIAGIVIIFIVMIQIVLMIFRDAAITILAGMLQLGAAGSFTRATSTWLPRLTAWLLALVCYKPMAALCYAAGLAFMNSHKNVTNFVIGIAVLALSLIALPALMRFFSWAVGSVGQQGGVSLLGAALVGGLQAATSLRAVGGDNAVEHARYMGSNGPGSTPGPQGSSTPAAPRPTGGGPSNTGGAQVFHGQVSRSGAAPSGAAPSSGGTSAATVAPPGGSTGSGAFVGGAAAGRAAMAGAASGGGAAASGASVAVGAAAGPAAPAAIAVAQTAVQAAHKAADTASNAVGGES